MFWLFTQHHKQWGNFNLMLLHVFIPEPTCHLLSLGGNQPVSGWNITHVPPPHLTQIIPSSPHPRVGLWYKNRWFRQRPHILHRDSCRHCCFSSPSHLLFDELPDDPGHLVSVHLHHRLSHFDAFVGICHSHVEGGSINGGFPFTARC